MATTPPVRVQQLQNEVRDARNYRRARHSGDPDRELLAVLRYGLMRMSPIYTSHSHPGDRIALGNYAAYQRVKLFGRFFPAQLVIHALRVALEADLEYSQRSDDARALAHALQKGDTHEMHHLCFSDLALARPRLRAIREYLLERTG